MEWESPLTLPLACQHQSRWYIVRVLTDNWEQGPSYDQQLALTVLWGLGRSSQICDMPEDTVWDRLPLVLWLPNRDLQDGTYR